MKIKRDELCALHVICCFSGFIHICVELFVTLWPITVRLQVCLPKNTMSASQMSPDDSSMIIT